MRLHRFTAPLIALLCLSFALADIAALAEDAPKPRGEKIALRLNLKKGDQKAVAQRMSFDFSFGVQGQTTISTVKIGMFLKALVEEVDAEKVHTIKLTYDRITADMASPLGSVKYDSKEPEKAGANSAFQTFNAMIGLGVSLKVTPGGATQEIVGLDELAKKMQEKLPEGVSAKQQLEAMKNAFEQFAAYPDKPVAIGETWKRKTKIGGDPSMAMEIDATYTLIDRRAGTAVIKMEGAMVARNMKGTSTGSFNMDEATGWITAGELTMDLNGENDGAVISLKGKSTVGEK